MKQYKNHLNRQNILSDCRIAGKIAAQRKKTLEDNPYNKDSDQYNAWEAGFLLYINDNSKQSK